MDGRAGDPKSINLADVRVLHLLCTINSISPQFGFQLSAGHKPAIRESLNRMMAVLREPLISWLFETSIAIYGSGL